MPDPSEPPRIRASLLALPPYEAVEPVEELARRAGLDPAEVLKLDANENPFGTVAWVQEAIARCDRYAVYPDPLQSEVRGAIAGYAGAPMDRVVAGAGSDELLDLAVRVLVGPGERVLVCPPAFDMYRFVAEVQGLAVDAVERRDDFSIDIERVEATVTEATSLIMLASPNNPTGNALSPEELRALLATGATVLVDEAYGEFAGSSFIPWVEEEPRLIVLRTFSKWAGLAGLRIGYGVFPEGVAEVLLRAKPPYSVNRAAEAAVLAALEARDELEERVRTIVAERETLFRELSALGWLRPYPSAANFLLCEVRSSQPGAPDGLALREALAQRGVFVRYFSTPRLRNCVRISVPRPEQTPVLMERLRAVGEELGLD